MFYIFFIDDSNTKGGTISNDGNKEKKIKDKNGILKKIPERKTREGEHNCEWVLRISKRKTRWAFTTKLSDITPHSHPMSSTPIIYREHRAVYGQERRKLTNQLKAGIKPRQIINLQSMDEPPVVVAPILVVESISSVTMSSYTLPPATPLLVPTRVPILSAMPQQQMQNSNLILSKDLYNLQQKIRADDNKRGNYEEMAEIYNFL